MTPIEEAILRTILYADVFNFPMTLREIHHFLITNHHVSYEQIAEAVATSPRLKAMIEFTGDYVVCRGRQDLIAVRRAREQASQTLWKEAIQYGCWLSRLPFVRMVALTGALAMRNAAADDDDLDYVVVTTAKRVWLARLFAVLLVRLARLRGVVVCPNYVLAENALAQEPQNIFMAHEVVQMSPIYGFTIYERMRTANRWVDDYLRNAQTAFYQEVERQPGQGWSALKRGLEALLGGRLGDALEGWERSRKLRKFAPHLQTPNHAAQLDEAHVKGHFNDHGHPVMEKYHNRLREYQLEHAPQTVSAD